MAMRTCEVCGERFYAGVGKPPRTCPEHRGIKLPPKNKRQQEKAEIPEKVEAIDHLPESTDNDRSDNRPDLSMYRRNKFAGRCSQCETRIGEGEGYLHGEPGSRKAYCETCLILTLQDEGRNQGTDTDKATDTDTDNLIKQVGESDAATAIQTLLKTLTPSINEEGVRAIVKDAIGDQLSEERISQLVRQAGVQKVEITINDQPTDMPEVAHYLLPEVIMTIATGEHVFLPGPAGSGKSTLAMQAAKLLGLNFHSISFGPTTPTSKLFGFTDANGITHRTEFYKAYACECDDDTYAYEACNCGGLFLGDEIDNGHPGLVAELNQALANPYCAFADRMVRRGRKFVMVVTGNTFGRGPDRMFVGRNILDAATLDRFTTIETPIDEAMETRVASAYAVGTYADLVTRWIGYVQQVRAKVQEHKFQFVVSPRATFGGAKLLNAGMDWERVCDIRLFAGMNAETRKVVA